MTEIDFNDFMERQGSATVTVNEGFSVRDGYHGNRESTI